MEGGNFKTLKTYQFLKDRRIYKTEDLLLEGSFGILKSSGRMATGVKE